LTRPSPLAAAGGLLLLGAVLWGAGGLAQQGEPPLPGEEPLQDAEAVATGAQPLPDPQDDDNGFLVNLIQGLLSAPGREVRIRGISGILSSTATIGEITVSDADGLWLRVRDVDIDWSRRALFLRRVQVNELSIGSIEYLRPALPPETEAPRLADAEARPFALPELPLAVRVESLALERLLIGEPVLGQEAELTAGGHLRLEGGALDSDLSLTRLDGPGGEFGVRASFDNETRVLDIDLAFSEPPGGIVATALDIEGRPAIDLTLQGAGPLDDIDLVFTLAADGATLAAGDVALRRVEEGLSFLADFSGALAPLVPADYRDFFAGESAVRLAGISKDAGGIRLDEIRVDADALDLSGSLETGDDNFLQSLDLTGRIGDPDAPPVTLPVPGGETVLNAGDIAIRYGEGDRWDGRIALDGLRSGDLSIDRIEVAMGGIAENLQDPPTRFVTIGIEGSASGIASADPAIDRALGERITLAAEAAIPPDAPIRLDRLDLDGAGLTLAATGSIADLVLSGDYRIAIADLRPFSGLAGRPLRGAAEVEARGDILLASGGFDLVLDGTARGLRLGEPRLDPLLAGETRLTGGLARDEDGLRTDAFRIANPQFEFTSSGRLSPVLTDIGFDARLADLALVLPDAAGAVTAEGRATGSEGDLALSLAAAIPEGSLLGRDLADLALRFDGRSADGDVTGTIAGSGDLDGNAIALAGEVALVGETARLSDLALDVGPNRITAALARTGEAPVEGRITIDAPDIRPLAALALVEASGAASADVTLGPAATGQGIATTAAIRDLVLGETRLATLDLEAEIEDAFGVPLADARLAAADVVAGGIEIASLAASASQTGPSTMDFAAETRLAIGTEARLSGGLERLEDGLALTLADLALEQDAITASLVAPATVTLIGDEIALTPLALDLGQGRIEAEGRVAEELDIALTIEALALDLADAVLPDLGLGGLVEGNARVTGPRAEPEIDFDLVARDVTAAPLAEAGLPPLTLAATGETVAGIVDFEALLTAAGGLEARLAGRAPTGEGPLDIAADIVSLPLALLDPVAGGQGLAGDVTGTARITGTTAAPDVAFDLAISDITADPIAGLPPLALAAQGRTDGAVLALEAVLTAPGGLEARARGAVPLGAGPLDLTIDLAALPLALVDPLGGGQGLQGSLTGQAMVTGTTDLPEIDFTLTGSGLSTAATRAAGLPAFALAATGSTDLALVDFEADLTAPGGLAASAAGSVPLGEGPLAVTIDLGQLPLAIIDPAAGGIGLRGSVTGSAAISGSLADPAATFSLAASGVSLAATREAGVPPLAASASGSFAGGVLTLAQGSVSGGGIEAAVSGTLPLEGPGLNLAVSGGLPLALANPFLAERAAQLAGVAEFDLALTGSLADPQVTGPLTVAGATFVDPQANVRLDNIGLDARLEGRSAVISAFSGTGAFGGTVTASGTVSLDAGAGFPLDLSIGLSNFGYTDGAFVSTRLSGALRLTGPVAANGGLLAGEIELDVTEISVAEALGAGGAQALEAVAHRNAPPGVLATLDRARIDEPTTREAEGNGLDLDVLVRAPNQIFVRGRGLDVELGGELRVTGAITDIQPVGQFNLIRGRLNILGQRIDFDEGNLQLVGNLDPIVFFVARTETQDAVAIVTVSGPVSAPDITFSSQPELPQDEVLALIIFNRTAQQLSPFQIAQLAAAAAELAGRGGNGLLAQFRGAVGLDDLDIVADEEGGAAVRAGRYIDDNIYLDVQTGTGGDTRVSINLDITDNVTARGTVGTDGNSTIGIYYQRDY
jgi:translocation and assembly module TamB